MKNITKRWHSSTTEVGNMGAITLSWTAGSMGVLLKPMERMAIGEKLPLSVE